MLKTTIEFKPHDPKRKRKRKRNNEKKMKKKGPKLQTIIKPTFLGLVCEPSRRQPHLWRFYNWSHRKKKPKNQASTTTMKHQKLHSSSRPRKQTKILYSPPTDQYHAASLPLLGRPKPRSKSKCTLSTLRVWLYILTTYPLENMH